MKLISLSELLCSIASSYLLTLAINAGEEKEPSINSFIPITVRNDVLTEDDIILLYIPKEDVI